MRGADGNAIEKGLGRQRLGRGCQDPRSSSNPQLPVSYSLLHPQGLEHAWKRVSHSINIYGMNE